jgi:hypothetical protein
MSTRVLLEYIFKLISMSRVKSPAGKQWRMKFQVMKKYHCVARKTCCPRHASLRIPSGLNGPTQLEKTSGTVCNCTENIIKYRLDTA